MWLRSDSDCVYSQSSFQASSRVGTDSSEASGTLTGTQRSGKTKLQSAVRNRFFALPPTDAGKLDEVRLEKTPLLPGLDLDREAEELLARSPTGVLTGLRSIFFIACHQKP